MEAYDFLRSEWLISFMLPYILVLYCSTGQMRVYYISCNFCFEAVQEADLL